jgi:hypothetical protein
MSFRDEWKSTWAEKSPWKVVLVVVLLLQLLNIGSIADQVYALKGAARYGVELYRELIDIGANVLREYLNLYLTRSQKDLVVLLSIWVGVTHLATATSVVEADPENKKRWHSWPFRSYNYIWSFAFWLVGLVFIMESETLRNPNIVVSMVGIMYTTTTVHGFMHRKLKYRQDFWMAIYLWLALLIFIVIAALSEGLNRI